MFHPSFGYQINVLPKYQVKQGHEVIIVTSDNIENHPTFYNFGNNNNIEEEDEEYMERTFITPIIKKNKFLVIRTQDDNYVNKDLGIPEELTPFISFGSDMSIFHPDTEKRKLFRDRNNINEDDFVVIYTGKLNESKGGKLLAKAFLDRFKARKNIVLVVVGNAKGEYEKEVEALFNQSQNRIIRFPTQKYVNLPKFYQMADLCVFPKQVSLSFYDAQACGLPVVAEDNNINIDRLNYNNGSVYRENDTESFRKKILDIVNLSDEEYNQMTFNAHRFVKENYNYEDIANQYTELLLNVHKKFYN
uniref:Glycosyl transferase family 1 domain-containing protein n=1 Tax=Batrachochytrium dendrobatidis (strain JAM81 / FGSC 10211) TaxID=684364 RepID=F4PFB0_BATDJ|eukprot:XP_006683293.1 hypothetical protein BATDEDRAFT_28833 [Batrachochytrium dendrobatidis JAM81]